VGLISSNSSISYGARCTHERPTYLEIARRALSEPVRLPAKICDWPESLRDLFEERAAIMEFDGGLTREAAERRAELDIRLTWQREIGREKYK
jgi:hypothetical protein